MNQSEFTQAIQQVTTPLPGSTPQAVVYKLTVKKRFEGLSIIDFFNEAVPRSTKELWKSKVKSGNLTVNGKTVTIDYKVKAGDLTQHSSEPKIEPEVNTNIQFIYEDDSILVVDKPSPLPMHASGRYARNTLLNILTLAFPDKDLKLLHRIDANTTGLVIIAKGKEIANNVRVQFEEKQIQKEYIALVEGIIEENNITSIQSIGNEVLVGGARKVDETGKKAETNITVLERRTAKNQTLLSVIPLTGRTNQIRLHLAELGFPIVGDEGHKNQEFFKNNPFTYPTDSLFLHAYKLNFKHPKTGKDISFEAPLPNKFKANLYL